MQGTEAPGYRTLYWPVISFRVAMHPGTTTDLTYHLRFSLCSPSPKKTFDRKQPPVLTARAIDCQFRVIAVLIFSAGDLFHAAL